MILHLESHSFQMDHNKSLFDGMVLFCAVVEGDSLASAARALGHTPSHVSKEIARLEARFGTRLLNRTTRKISLTETGQIYYDNARRIVLDAEVMKDKIQTLGDRPFGELKISVPAVFATGCFNAWLPEFLEAYPDISLNINVSDTKVDMVAEGFDMLVRIGTLPPSDMIARELFRTRMVTISSPGYLKARGTPKKPEELSNHVLIDTTMRGSSQFWTYSRPNALPVSFPVVPTVRCNDAEMEKVLVIAGKGITRLPHLACASEIKSRALVVILKDYEPEPAGVHILYANRQHLPPKTRAMADFLVQKTKQMKM